MFRLFLAAVCAATCSMTTPLSAQRQLEPRLEVPERPNFPKTTVFYLRYAEPKAVAETIQAFYSDLDKQAKIKIIPDERTNALFISASDETIKQIRDLLKVLDGDPPKNREMLPTKNADEIKVFTLRHASASEVIGIVKALFGDGLQLTADERTNAVIATGEKDSLATVEALLVKLDESQNQSGTLLKTYPLKHASTTKVINTLAQLGLSTNMAADDAHNRLLANGNAATHKLIQEALETIDVPAAKPAQKRLLLRIVWLVDEKLAGKDAAAPSKNLEKVVKVLEEKLGITNLKMAAQMLVTVDPDDRGYTFNARGTTRFQDSTSVELQAEGVVGATGTNPGIELSIQAEKLAVVDSNRIQQSNSRTLTSLNTKVAAPIGHSIVLGMTPIESADSVFVLQILSDEE